MEPNNLHNVGLEHADLLENQPIPTHLWRRVHPAKPDDVKLFVFQIICDPPPEVEERAINLELTADRSSVLSCSQILCYLVGWVVSNLTLSNC